MRVALTYIYVLIGSVYASLRQEIMREDASPLTTIVEEIAQSPSTHEVIIITRDRCKNEDIRRISEDLLRCISSSRSIRSVDLDCDYVEGLLWKWMATSRTLLIYIYAGETATNNLARTNIIKEMIHIVHPNDKSKVFLISTSRNASENFKDMLDFAWHYIVLLNIAMLEVLRCDEFQGSRVYVHQWNPFTAVYTKELYRGDPIDLFPDKLRDMHGYGVKIFVTNQVPYLTTEVSGSSCSFRGLTGGYINMLQQVMNFTVVPVMEKQGSEIIPELVGLGSYAVNHPFTVSVGKERVCFCIPRKIKHATISLSNIVLTVFAGLLLIFIFRLFIAAFKLDNEYGSIVNIVGLVFGVGAETLPATYAGRIMFLCLVLAITRYSSMFYTEMLSLIVTRHEEIKITSFEDLAESEWKVFVYDDMYTNFLQKFDMSPTLKNKIIILDTLQDYVTYVTSLKTYETMTTFLSEYACQYYTLQVRNEYNKTILKTADFCPVQLDLVYLLPRGTAHRDRINDIFLRATESKLDVALDLDRIIKEDILVSESNLYHAKSDRSRNTFDPRIIYVVLCGYVISIVVAIGEIIVGWVHRRKLRLMKMQVSPTDNRVEI